MPSQRKNTVTRSRLGSRIPMAVGSQQRPGALGDDAVNMMDNARVFGAFDYATTIWVKRRHHPLKLHRRRGVRLIREALWRRLNCAVSC